MGWGWGEDGMEKMSQAAYVCGRDLIESERGGRSKMDSFRTQEEARTK